MYIGGIVFHVTIYVIAMTCTTLFPNAGYWVLYIFEAYYLVKPTTKPKIF
jgi:hypothetical protein